MTNAPLIIQACAYSAIINSKCRVRLLDREDYFRFFNVEDPIVFKSLRPAHQADIVRIHALLEHGGMYIDSDTVVVRPLEYLFKLLWSHEYISGSYINPNCPGIFGNIGITVLGPARPKLECIRNIRNIQLQRLRHYSQSLLASPWKKTQSIDSIDTPANIAYPISWLELLDMISSEFQRTPPIMCVLDGYSTWYSYMAKPGWEEGGKHGHVYRKLGDGEKLADSDLYTFCWSGAPSAELEKKDVAYLSGLDWILAHLLQRAGVTGHEDMSSALHECTLRTREYLKRKS